MLKENRGYCETDKIVELYPAVAEDDAKERARQALTANPMALAFFNATGLIPMKPGRRNNHII